MPRPSQPFVTSYTGFSMSLTRQTIPALVT